LEKNPYIRASNEFEMDVRMEDSDSDSDIDSDIDSDSNDSYSEIIEVEIPYRNRR